MGLFDFVSGFLRGPVGNGRANDLDDIRAVKSRLAESGHFSGDTDNGYITREMDGAIRTFQSENGLKADGYLAPGGETERALEQAGRRTPPLPPRKPESYGPFLPKRPPLPERKPPILSEASDERAVGFVKKHEQPTEYLYKDNKGNMTVAIGHKVRLEEARTLPLYLHDKDGIPVRPATEPEIEKIYSQASAIRHGQNVIARDYDPKNNPHMQNIRMRKEDMALLLKKDLRSRAQELRRNWPGFDGLPEELKIAMLDAHFNAGTLTPGRWPGLAAAIRDRDAAGVRREIRRKTAHEDRNKAIEDMLKSIFDEKEER